MNKHDIKRKQYGASMNKMRARLRFLVRDLGWITTANRGQLSPEEWKQAGDKATEWFTTSNHSPVQLRKPIESMTHTQLREAVTIFERLLQNHFKQISQPHA